MKLTKGTDISDEALFCFYGQRANKRRPLYKEADEQMKQEVFLKIESRRKICLFLGTSLIFLLTPGCSVLKNRKKRGDAGEEFEDEETECEDRDSEQTSIFDSEREKQSQLSEYAARTGRTSKEKKKISKGDTFLLSDKAKEIYANTER